jgi:hypothetical protein
MDEDILIPYCTSCCVKLGDHHLDSCQYWGQVIPSETWLLKPRIIGMKYTIRCDVKTMHEFLDATGSAFELKLMVYHKWIPFLLNLLKATPGVKVCIPTR